MAIREKLAAQKKHIEELDRHMYNSLFLTRAFNLANSAPSQDLTKDHGGEHN